MRHVSLALAAITALAVSLGATFAWAGTPNAPPNIPTPAGMDATTAQQFRALMELQGLQRYGHRRGPVRGVDNPIINAGPTFDASGLLGGDTPSTQDSSGRKTSAEKRAEARQLKEE